MQRDGRKRGRSQPDQRGPFHILCLVGSRSTVHGCFLDIRSYGEGKALVWPWLSFQKRSTKAETGELQIAEGLLVSS
ncbi:hypothetical protein BRADI_3g07446v3 [Brachypodium distachyon]|uniref:Uncharacterized protein n=1 Tax=Brachypodium distachyon TaxID=15368 RepID=A0A2K2CVR2_BRADI|nr:hypothetical protein BRADI_3g07446v3 [Brachypodium distachyon]